MSPNFIHPLVNIQTGEISGGHITGNDYHSSLAHIVNFIWRLVYDESLLRLGGGLTELCDAFKSKVQIGI